LHATRKENNRSFRREAEQTVGIRRKSAITGHMNERDFPHLIELELRPEASAPRAKIRSSFKWVIIGLVVSRR
jgi:hypothetical protein